MSDADRLDHDACLALLRERTRKAEARYAVGAFAWAESARPDLIAAFQSAEADVDLLAQARPPTATWVATLDAWDAALHAIVMAYEAVRPREAGEV